MPIIYQDADFVAIDKPAGLLVHRSAISRDRVFALQLLRDQLGQRVYTVHRLDRATSGVLLFGLSPAAARALADAFEQRRVTKRYLAVTRGWIDDSGCIDHPVADDDGDEVPRPALTRYRCLARVELPFAVDRYPTSRYSLAEVLPETGRRQQIRRHFKHISHHLVGDTTHGNGRHNRFFRERFGIGQLLLRASRVDFVHPASGRPVAIAAAVDPAWRQVGRLFGFPLS